MFHSAIQVLLWLSAVMAAAASASSSLQLERSHRSRLVESIERNGLDMHVRRFLRDEAELRKVCRKIEQEILAAGHHVCILTTNSGRAEHTHMDGEHPNRQVVFLDNAIALPFTEDPNNPDLQYYLGFSLSPKIRAQIADFEPSLIHVTVPDCTS